MKRTAKEQHARDAYLDRLDSLEHDRGDALTCTPAWFASVAAGSYRHARWCHVVGNQHAKARALASAAEWKEKAQRAAGK